MAKPKIGGKAPAFTLQGTGGAWSLGAQAGSGAPAGSAVVIYFYPKDNTSGCTDEGKQFAALHKAFKKAGAQIVGISADSLKAHQNFKEKFAFPFELLSDPERKVCTLYDVIQEKSMYGRKYMGIERSTFLIDARGVLRGEWRKVKVPGHAQAVLAALQEL
ncbi:MAG: peroxiredoxin [Proteobacteria bacterium]|nr:peroxiredoxin [Pseudomonadota bacterium]